MITLVGEVELLEHQMGGPFIGTFRWIRKGIHDMDILMRTQFYVDIELILDGDSQSSWRLV